MGIETSPILLGTARLEWRLLSYIAATPARQRRMLDTVIPADHRDSQESNDLIRVMQLYLATRRTPCGTACCTESERLTRHAVSMLWDKNDQAWNIAALIDHVDWRYARYLARRILRQRVWVAAPPLAIELPRLKSP
jgi:hypothetical protein